MLTPGKLLQGALAAFGLFALAACGEPTILTVHANANTRTTPDLAIVTLGVSARGATAQAAQQAQSTRMAEVLAAARAAGVEETEVQTVGFSIDPQYVYPRNASPRVSGYISTNIVSIRVKDLSAVSRLIDTTVAEGANELHGIQFGFQDEEASRDTARAEAVQTARQRADAYAEAAGLRVRRTLAITEPGAVSTPMPYGYANYSMAEARASGAANQIMPGQLDAASSVTVVFELR